MYASHHPAGWDVSAVAANGGATRSLNPMNSFFGCQPVHFGVIGSNALLVGASVNGAIASPLKSRSTAFFSGAHAFGRAVATVPLDVVYDWTALWIPLRMMSTAAG